MPTAISMGFGKWILTNNKTIQNIWIVLININVNIETDKNVKVKIW